MNPDPSKSEKTDLENASTERTDENFLPEDKSLNEGLRNFLAKASVKTEHPKILRLVVIDNHELFREGMLRLLVMEGDFAPVTGAYAEAPSLVRHFWPDLVLFGLGPVKERGIRIAQSLRQKFPAVRLLLLDETVRTRHVREALAMKAGGYWTKHVGFAKILTAMRDVMSGGQTFCPEVEKHLRKTPAGLRFDPPHEHPAIAMLSPREAELLLLLAQGHSIRH